MAQFIKLTLKHNKRTVYVNMNLVSDIYEHEDNGTEITRELAHKIAVTETPQQIFEKLDNGETNLLSIPKNA